MSQISGGESREIDIDGEIRKRARPKSIALTPGRSTPGVNSGGLKGAEMGKQSNASLCDMTPNTSTNFHSVIQLKRSTSSILTNSTSPHAKKEFNLSRFLVTNKKKTVIKYTF